MNKELFTSATDVFFFLFRLMPEVTEVQFPHPLGITTEFHRLTRHYSSAPQSAQIMDTTHWVVNSKENIHFIASFIFSYLIAFRYVCTLDCCLVALLFELFIV